jgi:hypothetical protein
VPVSGSLTINVCEAWEADGWCAELSVAVTVKESVPAAVGVPVMNLRMK